MLVKREDILAAAPKRGESREVRIFMDGAFDVMHYGHMNAFRLGRSLGTYLIVGVNSDESITKCKGPPLMNDEERLTMVEGCKFVDEVVPNCPYVMTSEYLDYIFKTYDVDYVVHGDDPCIVDGKDVYASAKRRGRYRSIPRTEGVSTTDIVGRMLMLTKDHHVHQEEGDELAQTARERNANGEDRGVLGNQSKFLTTSNMMRMFSADVKPPEEGMRVVYVDGAWDMFHCGHVEFLREAAKVSEIVYLVLCSPRIDVPGFLIFAFLCTWHAERRLPDRRRPRRRGREQAQGRELAPDEPARARPVGARVQVHERRAHRRAAGGHSRHDRLAAHHRGLSRYRERLRDR